MTPDKISRNFKRCRDWEDRYLYLIELGERYATLPVEQRCAEALVSGCQSQVWLVLTIEQQPSETKSSEKLSSKLVLNAYSDAAIVRGLLALVRIAYDQQSLEDARAFDIRAWFEQLELTQHLTPTRTQGLHAILNAVEAQTRQSDEVVNTTNA
ncbi:hypothetical protein A3K86_16585 [Photobacterium jeanii]|uniref:Fe-S metabolism associated domain-containing protein n=1 Tax=Photobacterium jeanii TaxID=858640 RepID=A0A178K9E2_9GAMM|nr:SufE family protein [Photobacterium jeanii]OAN13273.1 hypothetical protein A3K86_16585 [Photobacterium jeanii]PST90270.1 cysteine dioxygenase [Photobacterium jeanii]